MNNIKNTLVLFGGLVLATGCTKIDDCRDIYFLHVAGETGYRFGPNDDPNTEVIEGVSFATLEEAEEYRTFMADAGADVMLGFTTTCE